MRCFFASDLHGHVDRYRKLWRQIAAERPQVVFLGGDLLPHGLARQAGRKSGQTDFVGDFLASGFTALREDLGPEYPRVFLILGNDDPRMLEAAFSAFGQSGLWEYVHNARRNLDDLSVYGYACVPPTPFLLKDWERYDVSRFVDPGCVSPEEGHRTVAVPAHQIRYRTIAADLQALAGDDDLQDAIFLFHSPPYRSLLDRADLDGRSVDHVPLDVHVGSIAIQRFIASRQPRITLHGHIHESARLTGAWQERIGRTFAFNAAHDGPELALIRLDTRDPKMATRELL